MVIDAIVRLASVELIVHVYKSNVQDWNVSTEADASSMEHASCVYVQEDIRGRTVNSWWITVNHSR